MTTTFQTVCSAVTEINGMLPEESRLPLAAETQLIGDASPLDSLGLVNLLAAVEEAVSRDFRTSVHLLELDFGEMGTEFRTIGSLTGYIDREMEK